MKKHPPHFRLCLILLLFSITSVQPLIEGDGSEVDSDSGVCQKNFEGEQTIDCGDKENGKSTFLENHECTTENIDSVNTNSGSCQRKEEVEDDEDQSELSMLGEQGKRRDLEKSCTLGKDEVSLSSDNSEDEDVNQVKIGSIADENSEEEDDDDDDQETLTNIDDESVTLPHAQVESPEEAENSDQDLEAENVPLQLREILLKLKPEGLTDNDDEQIVDFSVTEASMGEDDEVEEDMVVSSGSAEKQDAGIDNSSSETTKNGSGSGLNKKAVCAEVNTTEQPVLDVEIINATLLMKLLQGNPNVTNRSSAGPCHLIYFFSPYCPFSVAGSPYVNAMARSLKNIPVYGLDSIEHHSVNARYGVMGTPTLLLFHNGNGVGRYNASEFSVAQLLSFINHYTDQSVLDINVTSSDFRAHLPSQVAEGRPYALWASWIFLLSCAAWLFLTSELCARLTEAILNNWREAEAQNDQD